MVYSQKYCIVAFNHPIAIGTEFHMTDWPAHITLADIFAINLTSEFVQGLVNLLAAEPSFTAVARDETVLGTAHVVLIAKHNPLIKLHTHLIDLLTSHGATFNTPERVKAGFLPHCTIQKGERLHMGDQVDIYTVSLVDMFPEENWQQRKVLYNFKMKDAPSHIF